MHLQQYNFTIRHRPGKTNANADALSRLLPEEEEVQVFLLDLPAAEETLSETENRWDRSPAYISNSENSVKAVDPANENLWQQSEYLSDEEWHFSDTSEKDNWGTNYPSDSEKSEEFED